MLEACCALLMVVQKKVGREVVCLLQLCAQFFRFQLLLSFREFIKKKEWCIFVVRAMSTPSPHADECDETAEAFWLFLTNTRTTSLECEADRAAAIEFGRKFKDCKRSEMTAAVNEVLRLWIPENGTREDAVRIVANTWTSLDVRAAFERQCKAMEWPPEVQKKPYCTFVRPQDEAVAAEILKSIDEFLRPNDIIPAVSQQQFLCFANSKNFFHLDKADTDSGILCCDEQGGGKTFSALFALLHLWKKLDPSLTPKGNDFGEQTRFKRLPHTRPMLIVASKLTLATWMSEVARLSVPPNLFVFVESGRSLAENAQRVAAFETAGVIITTKSALSTDYASMYVSTTRGARDARTSLAQFPGAAWECVVVDEVDSVCAERVSFPPPCDADGSWAPIKHNALAHRGEYKREFRALLWTVFGCPRRLLMTGTPWVSNNPTGKICCIILLAWPLRAFKSDPQFASNINPNRGPANTLAYMLFQQRSDLVLWFQRNFVLGRTLNQVRAAALRGPIDRRTMYFTVHCNKTEHEILMALEKRMSNAIDTALTSGVAASGVKRIKTEQPTSGEMASMAFMTHLIRLRERTELNAQFSELAHNFKEQHGHANLPAELVASVPLSNKEIALIAILKHICKHPKRKVLLYTDFVVTNIRIAYLLKTCVPEMNAFPLFSAMQPTARQALIDGFNQCPGNAIFFTNIKCGERGLNLQTADTTIFLSSQYNPAAEEQAKLRNARLSTEHEVVTVIYLSMASTIQGWMSNIGADKLVQAMKIGCDDDPDDTVNRKRGLDGKLKSKQVVEAHKARQFAVDVLKFAANRTPRANPDPLIGLCNCGGNMKAEMSAVVKQFVNCA